MREHCLKSIGLVKKCAFDPSFGGDMIVIIITIILIIKQLAAVSAQRMRISTALHGSFHYKPECSFSFYARVDYVARLLVPCFCCQHLYTN